MTNLMRAKEQQKERDVFGGQVPVDDACLGAERTVGKAGRGSENRLSSEVAASFSEEFPPCVPDSRSFPALL